MAQATVEPARKASIFQDETKRRESVAALTQGTGESVELSSSR